MPRRGEERSKPKASVSLFQVGFGFALGTFSTFFALDALFTASPFPKSFSQRARRGFWGAPEPAWIGHLRACLSEIRMDKGLPGASSEMP